MERFVAMGGGEMPSLFECVWCGGRREIVKPLFQRAKWVCWGCRIKAKCRVSNDPNGCWIWRGATRGDYGIIRIRTSAKYLWRNAHRLAYAVWRGPIAKSWAVEHNCGQKLCCNPDHLVLKQQPLPLDTAWAKELIID